MSINKVVKYKDKTNLDATKLSVPIFISPKAVVTFEPECIIEEFETTAVITIGIGRDHVAELRMSIEALESLKSGSKLHVTTVKELTSKIKK